MIRCCVVADDLTGANATGVGLRSEGLRTCTLLRSDSLSESHQDRFDAVTIPTDSRGIPASEAYSRVKEVTGRLVSPEVLVYNKRIDSTLRGNIGREIDAMLDSFEGPRTAIVVPVYPQAGRVAAGGYLLVNGVLLERTDAARDPKMPVRSSVTHEIVAHQTQYPVTHIDLTTVYGGADAIADALHKLDFEKRRIVVFDALTDDDIDSIAEGVVSSGLPFITADPGPFTAAMARKLVSPQREEQAGPRVLMCVGSVTSTTVEQLQHAFDELNVEAAFLQAERVVENPSEAEAEVERVIGVLRGKASGARVICVTSNRLDLSQTLDLEAEARKQGVNGEELSHRINGSIAKAAERLLREHPTIDGLYASGGDITVAICQELGASGVELEKAVMPLAAQGKLVGGERAGLNIVSKGGMVGGADAATQCVHSLLEAIRN